MILLKNFKLGHLLSLIFFTVAFLFLLRPVGAEQDFWWHISSGKWIWEHGVLPKSDPFSLFASPHPNRIEMMILKGYWLSQISYYLLYQSGGLTAICVLGALTMVATVFMVWRTLILRNIPHHVSLVALTPLVVMLGFFSEHRPQQFSFLFFALLLYLLERTIANVSQNSYLGIPAYLVPLVILIWVQMHPGYAVAFPLIFIYLAAVFSIQMKTNSSRKTAFTFFLLVVTGILATITAPNGPAALADIFSSTTDLFLHNKVNALTFNTVDHTRPWQVGHVFGSWYWRFHLSCLVAVFIACCAGYKYIPKQIIVTVALYGVLSLVATRFGIFFIIPGTIVTGLFIAVLMKSFTLRTALLTCSIAIAGSMLLLIFLIPGRGLIAKGNFTPSLVSDNAVSFLLASNIPGAVANPYSWGGYLMWRIWPRYKIFCDQRDFRNSGGERSGDIMFMEDTAILDQLGVNAVVINVFDPVTASVYYGFITLIESSRWDLVYYDDISAIFARSGRLPSLKKADLENDMIDSLTQWRKDSPDNIIPNLLLGQIAFWRGNFSEAKNNFLTAAELDPGDERPRNWLGALRNAEKAAKPALFKK